MAYDRELADRIREHVGQEPGLTEKAMFGGLAFLINGRMAVCAGSNGELMLRVEKADIETLLERPAARPFVMRGREMTGWLSVDGHVSDEELAEWISRGVAVAKSLQPT